MSISIYGDITHKEEPISLEIWKYGDETWSYKCSGRQEVSLKRGGGAGAVCGLQEGEKQRRGGLSGRGPHMDLGRAEKKEGADNCDAIYRYTAPHRTKGVRRSPN